MQIYHLKLCILKKKYMQNRYLTYKIYFSKVDIKYMEWMWVVSGCVILKYLCPQLCSMKNY